MKVDKVMIVIQSTDEEFASVKLVTDPDISSTNLDELEETPAVLLGSAVWGVVQDFLEENGGDSRSVQ